MTQKELIIAYLKENGSITPAKMGGKGYKGEFFGSETSKRCREMRKAGMLRSVPDGKFEVFYLKERITLPLARIEKIKTNTLL